MKIVTGVLVATILSLALFAPKARASEFDKSILLTFRRPVQIPHNRVLGAGSYWFVEPASPDNDLSVVIYNADRSVIEGVLLTRLSFRRTATEKAQVTVVMQGRKKPDALLSWFDPDSRYGHTLVYSRRTERRMNEEPKRTY